MDVDAHKPTLKAIILDFSSVNNIDITSIQHLIDVRNQLDRYASPETVQWHFACINNRWTKRGLAAAGFGYPSIEGDEGGYQRWKPIFSVAELGGSQSAAADAERDLNRKITTDVENGRRSQSHPREINVDTSDSASSRNSIEKAINTSKAYAHKRRDSNTKVAVVHGLNRPLFHIDLTSALQSAIANVENREVVSHIEPETHLGGLTNTDNIP